MKRQNFIKACLAAATFINFPFKGVAKSITKDRGRNGFFVEAGKARFDKKISLFQGDTFFTKISPHDTDGDLYIYESTRLHEGGPAHHYHFSQDEWWYVLQGEFLIKVDEITYHAKPGDSVFGPRMVPHSFAKVGEGEGKLIMVFQPAGKMEECFIKISEGATTNMTAEELVKFREEHGMKQVGPPITFLKSGK